MHIYICVSMRILYSRNIILKLVYAPALSSTDTCRMIYQHTHHIVITWWWWVCSSPLWIQAPFSHTCESTQDIACLCLMTEWKAYKQKLKWMLRDTGVTQTPLRSSLLLEFKLHMIHGVFVCVYLTCLEKRVLKNYLPTEQCWKPGASQWGDQGALKRLISKEKVPVKNMYTHQTHYNSPRHEWVRQPTQSLVFSVHCPLSNPPLIN